MRSNPGMSNASARRANVSPRSTASDDEIEKLKFMASFGHDGKSIARALDRTPQSVRVKAVEIGVRLRPPKMHHRRIKLSTQAWRALQAEADRLGMSAGRLARLVIETVRATSCSVPSSTRLWLIFVRPHTRRKCAGSKHD